MARFDYGTMQATATRLLDRFQRGTVSLKRVTVGSPPNDWTPGESVETLHPLKATVKRLHQRYENGVLIVETDDMVTFAVPAVVPALTDTLVVEGVERAITNLTPIPPAGVTVAYRCWCAA